MRTWQGPCKRQDRCPRSPSITQLDWLRLTDGWGDDEEMDEPGLATDDQRGTESNSEPKLPTAAAGEVPADAKYTQDRVSKNILQEAFQRIQEEKAKMQISAPTLANAHPAERWGVARPVQAGAMRTGACSRT